MKDRFRVVWGSDAKRLGLDGIGRWTEEEEGLLYDYSTNPPTFVQSDRIEPEDVSFYRDLAWVPKLLNKLEEEKDES